MSALYRGPGWVCVALAVGWLTRPFSLGLFAGLAVLILAARLWMHRRPVAGARAVAPLRAWVWRRRLGRDWTELCRRCGLACDDEVPALRGTAGRWPHVRATVRPLMGQTLGSFESAAEALRMGVGASRLRVEPHGHRDVGLVFTVADELRDPFAASEGPAHPAGDSLVMGRAEGGEPWRIAVGPHTLVAGCSGSGKGSVFWSFAFGLAPAVREGTVQLHGIDLKGGMEVAMGKELFTTSATDAAEAVALLEMLVDWMRQRSLDYAGHVRSHQASVAEPLHVVMIDELAALTAYSADRTLQRRAEAAVNLLCSQGRAPGFVVFACLQDPRKEVIPSRGLFTQMVGLRLKDLSETSMVLGERAVEVGAHCHRITRDAPGTGYVVPEDGRPPMRVRAGHVSDHAIHRVAERFATPTHVEVPELENTEPSRGRPRRAEVA